MLRPRHRRVALAALTAAVTIAAVFLTGGASGADHARKAGLRLKQVGTFNSPIYVTGPKHANGNVFVVERTGKIKVLHKGKPAGTFLNIAKRVRCCDVERGLFSVAFRNYAKDRRFYVDYTDHTGDVRVVEFKIRRRGNRPRAKVSSARSVLRIAHRQAGNHNGGQLQFGPGRLLYVSVGDAANSANAPSKSHLQGKILRIDPRKKGKKRYRVPRSNPYVGKKGRNEIFARGFRNPYRFSINGKTLAIGDVGESTWEEIDYVKIGRANGGNFGWPNYEGYTTYQGPPLKHKIKPIHVYRHASGVCAIIGGFVSHDPKIKRLRGRYLYGDLCSGQIRSLKPHRPKARHDRSTGLPRKPGELVSFGVDAKRRNYVVDSGGPVYRIAKR